MDHHHDGEVHLPDLHPHHRSPLHDRYKQGEAGGDHEDEGDEMHDRERFDEHSMAAAFEKFSMGRNGEGASSAKPAGLRFDWSMNLGHLVAIGTILTGVFASYYGVKGELAQDTFERAALTHRVEDIERGRMVNLPKLDEQGQHNKVQDEQIQSLREAIQSLRLTVQDQARNITDLTKLIYDANAKVLVLENQIVRSRAGLPHDN